jgi:hypothetical protein
MSSQLPLLSILLEKIFLNCLQSAKKILLIFLIFKFIMLLKKRPATRSLTTPLQHSIEIKEKEEEKTRI